tara:strand:- start:2849 stop:3484 length:636 start_codon:yes stop_codon:yes gene_type:complete
MKNKSIEIHKWFNKLERHSFPFNENRISNNGIYILFEKGEKFNSFDRIVRVGTHTGNNKLVSRLKEHFLNENKDRSIFRKNIGRAFLNRENNPFLEYWEMDLTSKQARLELEHKVDFNLKNITESKVSDYIQNNFSFATFQINEKNKRVYFEKKLISTISLCSDCNPSKDWLGNFSTKDKIRKSGLWQVNELWKDSISDTEMEELRLILKV